MDQTDGSSQHSARHSIARPVAAARNPAASQQPSFSGIPVDTFSQFGAVEEDSDAENAEDVETKIAAVIIAIAAADDVELELDAVLHNITKHRSRWLSTYNPDTDSLTATGKVAAGILIKALSN